MLVGLRELTAKTFDLTFSAPKSVSVPWALGSELVADVAMGAHREAVVRRSSLGGTGPGFRVDGLRRHVPTEGGWWPSSYIAPRAPFVSWAHGQSGVVKPNGADPSSAR
jgi:hypothetical protein